MMTIICLTSYMNTCMERLGKYAQKKHNIYVNQAFHTKVTYEFPTYKVIDATEEELLASENPFALVVLACKYLNSCKKDSEKRFTLKEKLIIFARERNYSDIQILGLLRFIDFLIVLPKNLETKIHSLILEKFVPMEAKKKYQTNSSRLSEGIHEHLYGETWETRSERMSRILLENGVAPELIANTFNIYLEKVLSFLPNQGEKK